MIGKPQIHPLFEIILDNWRLHGFAAKKESYKKTSASNLAEKKAKSLPNVSNTFKEKSKWSQ